MAAFANYHQLSRKVNLLRSLQTTRQFGALAMTTQQKPSSHAPTQEPFKTHAAFSTLLGSRYNVLLKDTCLCTPVIPRAFASTSNDSTDTIQMSENIGSSKAPVYPPGMEQEIITPQLKETDGIPDEGIQQMLQAGNESRFFLWHQICYDYIRPYASREFFPVDLAATGLENLQYFTGMPMWSTIVVGTLIAKACIVFPISLISARSQAKHEILKPEIDRKMSGLYIQAQRDYSKGVYRTEQEMTYHLRIQKGDYMREMFQKHNFHPAKNFLPIFFQLFLFFSLAFAIREILGIPAYDPLSLFSASNTAFANQGTLWFPNLLVPDKTGGLSLLIIGTSLFNHESMIALREAQGIQIGKTRFRGLFIRWFPRGIVLYMGTVSYFLPAGLPVYFFTSALYQTGQMMLLMSPKFKKFAKITTGKETRVQNQPYRFLMFALRQKFFRR